MIKIGYGEVILLAMGIIKKIGIGFGVIVVLFFVMGLAVVLSFDDGGASSPPVMLSESKELNKQADHITYPILDVREYILDRSDIGTKWVIGETSGLEPLNADGFEDGVSSKYFQHPTSEFGSGDVVKVSIYRFDSDENARKKYDERISELYETGGFKEVKNLPRKADGCYGTDKDVQYSKQVVIRCVMNNLYFVVSGTGNIFETKYDAKDFAQSLIDKIKS